MLGLAGLSLVGLGAAGAGAIQLRTTGGLAGWSAAAAPPSPTPDLVAVAKKQVEQYASGVNGRLSLAVHDRTTGARFTVGARRFRTASIVKVDILAALLLREQSLSTAQKNLATDMITVSDNDAASRLFRSAGGVSGLEEANDALGLTETTPDIRWGVTTTTAADQVRLLGSICDQKSPLTPSARKFVLGLMTKVVDEQRWGVPAAASPQASGVWVKNGWVQVSADDNLWLVNSIGRIVEGEHDWLVAVLSDHHATQERGIEVVEGAAEVALRALRAP